MNTVYHLNFAAVTGVAPLSKCQTTQSTHQPFIMDNTYLYIQVCTIIYVNTYL